MKTKSLAKAVKGSIKTKYGDTVDDVGWGSLSDVPIKTGKTLGLVIQDLELQDFLLEKKIDLLMTKIETLDENIERILKFNQELSKHVEKQQNHIIKQSDEIERLNSVGDIV